MVIFFFKETDCGRVLISWNTELNRMTWQQDGSENVGGVKLFITSFCENHRSMWKPDENTNLRWWEDLFQRDYVTPPPFRHHSSLKALVFMLATASSAEQENRSSGGGEGGVVLI